MISYLRVVVCVLMAAVGVQAQAEPPSALLNGSPDFVPAAVPDGTVATSPAYYFTTLAGYTLSDNSDGVGPEATFFRPTGIAADRQGNFYVVDELSFTIRRVSAAGVVTTIAGRSGDRGFADGMNGTARFYSPAAITVDPAGNVYVGDWYTVRRLSQIGTNWLVTTVAGQVGTIGYRDGPNLGARFRGPSGLAVGPNNVIYVADGSVRKIERVGADWVVSTVANSQGYTLIPNFSGPDFTNTVGVYAGNAGAIVVDGSGATFVADPSGHTISRLTLPEGTTNWVSATVAGADGIPGTADGVGSEARFNHPSAITMDRLGNVYVADGLGNPQVPNGGRTVRRLSPLVNGVEWVVSPVAGTPEAMGSTDGIGTNALFTDLSGIAADPLNNLAVTDSREVRKVTSAGVVKVIAGSATTVTAGSADGIRDQARFNFPAGTAVDGAGNVYVADTRNSTIRVVTPAGLVSTLAGSPSNPGHADGVASNARFGQPEGLAVDAASHVFVADGDTIRMITPAAVVSTIAGAPGVSGFQNGPGRDARFFGAYDIAVDAAGNLMVSDSGNGAVRKLTRSGTNWLVSTVAVVPGFPQGLAVDRDGRIYVLSNQQIQEIAPEGTNWIVRVIGSAPNYHIAVDGTGRLFVTMAGGRTILQYARTGTNWVASTIGGSTDFLFEGGNADGPGVEARFKVPFGIAADAAGNLYISDVVNNNIRKGTFMQFAARNAVPYLQPPRSARLDVTLLPAEAGAQWRFPWDATWRNSGESLTNLVQGNYPIEFRARLGWLPIPSSLVIAVTNGGTTALTNNCFPTLAAVEPGRAGTLTVTIGPSPPAGAGWRIAGEMVAFFPPGQAVTLEAGTYAIEFAPVSGRVRPSTQWVHIDSGASRTISVNYLLANPPPGDAVLPVPVPLAQINDATNHPFAMNGQLQSDLGFGSGVAVQTNVVLTAAHLVFNDQNLSYVREVYWHPQKTAGVFEPQPIAARGWYVLAGYAAQRTNDLQIYSPGTSTPQSRNLDVAALYFLSPAAGGGYSGFLPSDGVPNPWLTGSSLKMMVGYPVDGSLFGDASIVPGRMYQTLPQPYALSLATDPVANQQVYVAPWLLGYPGQSGGPFYAQFNGVYYPAGIYLGTLFNGTQPFASAIRAIDSQIERLISLAARQGDLGTNNTGGGVTTITPSALISASNPGYLQVRLEPPAAVQAGAAWKLINDTTFSSSPTYTRAIRSTNAFTVDFKPVPGWEIPVNQSITVFPNPTVPTVVTGFYSVMPPRLVVDRSGDGGNLLGIMGTTGTVYRLEMTSTLSGGEWQAVSTNLLRSVNLNPVLTNPSAPSVYRLRWLP